MKRRRPWGCAADRERGSIVPSPRSDGSCLGKQPEENEDDDRPVPAVPADPACRDPASGSGADD